MRLDLYALSEAIMRRNDINPSRFGANGTRSATVIERSQLITADDPDAHILAPREPGASDLVAVELKVDDLSLKRWLREAK